MDTPILANRQILSIIVFLFCFFGDTWCSLQEWSRTMIDKEKIKREKERVGEWVREPVLTPCFDDDDDDDCFSSWWSVSHRRNVGSLSLYFRYVYGRCSYKLHSFLPPVRDFAGNRFAVAVIYLNLFILDETNSWVM